MSDFNKNYFYSLFHSQNWLELDKYLNSFNSHSEIFKKRDIILNYYVANFYLKNYKKCQEIIKLFKNCEEVDNYIIEQTDFLKEIIFKNKKIIGSYDYNRQPENENEIIIIIGDYPVGYDSLIINNPIRRNYKWALNFNYHHFEGHESWNYVDKFYVINMNEREDRLYDILKECKKGLIPLTKVEKVLAQTYSEKHNNYVNGSIGCSLSHLKVIKDILVNKYKNTIVFEDDFTFSDPILKHLDNIKKFFERGYTYDVTFLSYSALHHKEDFDDLLKLSFQHCTTASGYIISLEGSKKIKSIWQEGLDKLIKTEDVEQYACDIYWNKIQNDRKMFLFVEKIGYQRPSYSTISKRLVYNLD